MTDRHSARAAAGAPVTILAGLASQAGNVGLATDRVTFMVGYGAGPVQLDWPLRYFRPEKRSGVPRQASLDPSLPSYTMNDVNLGYRLKVDGNVFVIIKNGRYEAVVQFARRFGMQRPVGAVLPQINFKGLAEGMGVRAASATSGKVRLVHGVCWS